MVCPETFASPQGRLKPYSADRSQSFYTAELLPLLCNDKLYGAAVDIFHSEYLRPGRRSKAKSTSRFNVGIGGCCYVSDVRKGLRI